LGTVGSATLPPVHAQITGEQVISGDNGGWSVGWAQANNGRLYHLGDLYGIYRSDDRGQTWTQTLKGFQSDEEWIAYGVAVVPTNANKVYYYGGNRICRSLDGGDSWPIYTTVSREGIGRSRGAEQLVIKPGTEDEVWAVGRINATDKATVIRSTNGGSSFSAVGGSTFSSDFRTAKTIHFRPTNTNHVWIGTSDGVYASTDGGSNWTLVAGTSGRSISAIGLSKVAGNNIAIVAASTWCRAVTASDWNNVSTYSASTVIFDNGGKGSNGDLLALRNGDFLLSDSTRNVMRIGPTGNVIGLISSTRNNQTGSQVPAWADMPKEIAKGDNWMREDLWQDVSQDNTIYSDGGAGPSISTDLGQTWTFITKGVRGVVTRKPVLVEGNSNLAIFPCNDKGVLVHNGGGNSDSLVGIAKKDLNYEALFVMNNVTPFGNGQTLYGGGAFQGGPGNNYPIVIKSTNSGVNWTQLAANGLPSSPAKGLGNVIADIVVDKDNSNDLLVLMGEDYGSVHRSTDGGVNFGPALGGINAVQTGAQDFKSSFLVRDGVLSNRRYLAVRTRDSRPSYYVSDDKGASWTSRARPAGDPSGFSVDPKTAGKVWLGTNFDLHTSNDGGQNWIKVDNFQGVVSVDAFNGKVLIYARRNNASTFDLWYSPDNGSNWQQLTNSTWRFPSTRNPDNVTRWTFTLDPNNTNRFWVSGISGAVYTFTATGSSASAPSITSNPSSVTVTAGNSATFSVAANGNPAPTLQWQRAANGSSTFSNLTAGGAYSGVTSGNLTVSNTTTTMSGDQFRAIATNSQGSVTSSAATLTVNQVAAPTITSALTRSATVGTAISSYTITATNSPTSYNATSLPAGLSVNTSTGVISGTPTTAGTVNTTISATNAGGTGSATLVFTISAAPVSAPSITSALTRSATVGTAISSYTITATNSPTSYNATNLPAGLSVNTSTGVISGTPTTAGTFNTTISATNSGGTGSATLVFTISAATGGTNTGTGLRARYYTNTGLTGSPALTRTDSTVNFSWSGSPGSGIGSDNFSVRWDGRIEAPVTGAYTFSTETDDGVRLWINGVLVLNQWVNQAPTVVTGSTTLNLTAGTLYRVVLEYYEAGGGAVARLRWAYPGQATQIIPQGRLYPATSTILSVSNSSFESNTGQTPTDWSTWANTTANEACDFVETANPRIGSNNLRHASSTGAYQVNTFRTLTGLTNGTYLVRAWTRSSGGQAAAGFHVSNHGSPGQIYFDVKDATSAYVERTLSVPVTNGQMTIGFWSDATASNQWLIADEISVERQP
jgi:hypothetical protein